MGNRINNNLANNLENFRISIVNSINAINEKFQNSINSQNAINQKILEVLNKLSKKLDEQNK